MSSYILKAKHKATGEIHEIFAIDDYFGSHNYGYMPPHKGADNLTEKEFHQQYEPCEVANVERF